jgi:glycosyltransferase involved in cell wall biosynthesis
VLDADAGVAETIAAGVPRPPLAICVQLPFWTDAAIRLRDLLGAPLVYDRYDLHADFTGIPPAVADAERRLMEAADLVAASSSALLPRNTAVPQLMVRNGVALEDFAVAPRPRPQPPVVAYVGALCGWFDSDLVEALAARRPDWRLRFAGRVEDEGVRRLGRLPNVELLGEVPYRRVPDLLASASALLVPFRDVPLTRAADPVKLYESLAAGVPVVARALPEVLRWSQPAVYAYHTVEEAEAQLARALAETSAEHAACRRAAVAGETWDARAATLLAAVASLARQRGRAGLPPPRQVEERVPLARARR